MKIGEANKLQKEKVVGFFNGDDYWQGDIYKKNNQAYFSRLVKRRKKYVFDLLDTLPKGRVNRALDVGCGAGEYMKELLKRGIYTTGIDTSEGMLRNSERTLEKLDNWSLLHGDIEDIPIQKEVIDMTLCIGVLPYLLEDNKALQELNRVVKPSGYLIITASNWFCMDHYHTLMKAWIGDLFGKKSEIEEFQPGISYTSPWFLKNSSSNYRFKAYNLRAFNQLMESHGFRLVDGMTYGFKFPLLRRYRLLPATVLDALELKLETLLRRFQLPILGMSGFEFIGLYQKV